MKQTSLFLCAPKVLLALPCTSFKEKFNLEEISALSVVADLVFSDSLLCFDPIFFSKLRVLLLKSAPAWESIQSLCDDAESFGSSKHENRFYRWIIERTNTGWAKFLVMRYGGVRHAILLPSFPPSLLSSFPPFLLSSVPHSLFPTSI